MDIGTQKFDTIIKHIMDFKGLASILLVTAITAFIFSDDVVRFVTPVEKLPGYEVVQDVSVGNYELAWTKASDNGISFDTNKSGNITWYTCKSNINFALPLIRGNKGYFKITTRRNNITNETYSRVIKWSQKIDDNNKGT